MRRPSGWLLAWTASLTLCGCVVSTYEPVGSPPSVSLAAQPETVAPIDVGPPQIGASHVLIAYRGAMRAAPYVDRTKAEALALAQQLRLRALAGEDFASLSKEYSDDKGSAAHGGSLGVFKREQMVPSFSKAAFALEVGDTSAVVESAFGFHVIMRTE